MGRGGAGGGCGAGGAEIEALAGSFIRPATERSEAERQPPGALGAGLRAEEEARHEA